MDYLYLQKTVKELNKLFKAQRIKEITNSENGISITFSNKKTLNVYLGYPNAIFISDKKFSDFKTFSSAEKLTVKEFKLPVKDRVLELELLKISLSGKIQKLFLILELTGKTANAFLLNENRKIVATLKKVETSVRNVSVGEAYQFPPNDKKEIEEIQFGKVTPEGIEKQLHKFVKGISPLNSKEIAFIFRKTNNLIEAYRIFLEKHENSQNPHLYRQNDKIKYLTTFKYESLRDYEGEKIEAEYPFLEAWKILYIEKVENETLKNVKRKLLERLNKKLHSLQKELSEVSNPESIKSEALHYKKLGELLKYNLYAVNKGETKIKTYDYETEKEIEIPIDPTLSPQENLERYFKQYKKLINKYEHSFKRKEELLKEIKQINNLIDVIEKAENIKELPLLETESSKAQKNKELPFRIYTLPTGKKLLIGKNSNGNETITFKIARPWDLWFHVKDIPGSHVILMREKNEPPTKEELELSASAAVFFSKARNGGKVKVDYVEVKNLKKPPKSKAGFVIYRGEKSVLIDDKPFREFLKGED
ncbi:Predicted component of the ribosome quality control (RQC) complex, YloA/Tae2 family, contains fibronectin-binding (FbpA) and DUF814 domains [Desulfurobacterium pacificum]|uniref:Predicted component of the ribosome quality control (RQC) complex, YloA/Tae2 family, contains fibronectin-binding (FbpA) and DUF814 domains n=1 Tax=Desulfurobacterium pacificum TaxID=240166 RepID=A0ABY1NGJ5_9BACT|nr:NFACT family protein [Desulfurobacterium pacificum]SMP08772.1 Predicted component of the ribosome quality control (RQC) complex, YloA/Tae2 family, contains fibronectin-binding (FbpA) and DUF814 domains [Desulfurobacterium pacificum]